MQKYKSIQITLHWLTLLLVIAIFASIYMSGFISSLKNVHFNLGVIVWFIVAIRLILKFKFKAPPIVPPLTRVQQLASKSVHDCLYLLFLAQPILGVVLTPAYIGKSWSFMGIEVGPLVNITEDFSYKLRDIHEIVGIVIMMMVGLHAAAALFHHFVKHDNTLLRMLPTHKKK